MELNRFPEARILVIDDQEANVRLLERMLDRQGYAAITTCTDPRRVVSLFKTVWPDLLILDLHMPELDGFEVMEQVRPLVPRGVYLPILVVTADVNDQVKRRALSSGATDFLIKPYDASELVLRIGNLLETRSLYLRLADQNHLLEDRVRERTSELELARSELLDRLAMAAEFRDDETREHTRRVGDASALVGAAIGLPAEQVELLRRAAPLHDVGKIGIVDRILLKPDKLTPEEFAHVKSHTLIGSRLLENSSVSVLQLAQEIALTHHERWDGTGYPRGLEGPSIPLSGRIVTVVDVFDALTHGRPYRQAWTAEAAVAEIDRQQGRQFDPEVTDAFIRLVGEGQLGRVRVSG